MKHPSKSEALAEVIDRLTDLLDMEPTRVDLRQVPSNAVGERFDEPDALAKLGGFTFVIEWRSADSLAAVARGAARARRAASAVAASAIPLLALPYMAAAGREYCSAEGVSWLDLSGNASINGPGLRIYVNGQANRFKKPGRPSSPFAPKSSRVARWLLMHPGTFLTQREIAHATGMDEGFTSRIVSRLEADGLIERNASRAIRVHDPDLLLDAWREDYDFSKHEILRGHIAARSGDQLLGLLTSGLSSLDIQHAATGLAAAWRLNHFASFRLATVYVAERPPHHSLQSLGFREGDEGANVWLVRPADEGIFHGAADVDAVRCVHPVQVYLDLQQHPERAREAAAHLRSESLNWSADA